MALFEPIFEALNSSGCRYVIVGGVAVVLHGHARLTADLDVVVDLSPEPALAAISALGEIGLKPRLPVEAIDFANPTIRARWIDERGMTVFSMWDPNDAMRSVDLLVESPIDFEDLLKESKVVELGALSIRVASIPHLIRLKELAGRTQDLADIEALEALSASHEGQ